MIMSARHRPIPRLRRGRVLGVAFVAIWQSCSPGFPRKPPLCGRARGTRRICNAVIRETSAWHYYDTTNPTIVSFTAPKYIALDATSRSHSSSPHGSRTAVPASAVSCGATPTRHLQHARGQSGQRGRVRRHLQVRRERLAQHAGGRAPAECRRSMPSTGSPTSRCPRSQVVADVHDRVQDPTTSRAGSSRRPRSPTSCARPTPRGRRPASRRSPRAGTSCWARRFTVATPTTPGKLSAVKVRVQRHYSGGSWTYISGLLTTSSTAACHFSINPTKTATYRFVYAGKFAAPWNAPVTSPTVAVNVH